MSALGNDRQWDYIISFNTKAQFRTVLRILKGHNDHVANPHKYPTHYVRQHIHEKFQRAAPGNELWAVDLVTFKKGWRVGDQASPANGPALARGVVFSNTGDAAQKNRVFHYLNWHLLRAIPSVYHDSFPAMGVYVCDDAVLNSLASREALADDCIHCTTDPKPEDPMDLIKPAYWITRKLEGNPAYRELMMETRGNEERRKRSRDEANKNIVPYLSEYESVEDGWTVSDRDGWGGYFDKDSRERAENYARHVHAVGWGGARKEEDERAAAAAERVD